MMWGAGNCHCHRRRLRLPRPPSLTLEEGDAFICRAAGRPPGSRSAARYAQRAPAPGRLRRAPAPGAARPLPGAGGKGPRRDEGRWRWETSVSSRGHGGQVYVNNGQARRAGARGRAASLPASPSPALAGLGAGSLMMPSPASCSPAARVPCSNPRRPLSPAIWSAPGCPVSHHWLERQLC